MDNIVPLMAQNTVEPNDLLLFARVVEAGSFSRAAERVGLPKSTVSRRISELERQLGERVLQRTTRKLALTEFGQNVLDHARQVVTEVEGTLALALHRQALPSGKLRVSMASDIANLALAGMLGDFVKAHPAIALEIDLSPRRVDLIGENFDLAIRIGDLTEDSQLAARRVALFTSGLYAAPSYLRSHGEPQTPEALVQMHGLMILSRAGDPVPWAMQRQSDGAAWQGMPAQRTLANSPDLLTRFARDGAGIAAVSDFYVESLVRSGELQRVLPDWCPKPVPAWAVFPGRRLMPTKTRVFIDALVAALKPCDGSAQERALPSPADQATQETVMPDNLKSRGGQDRQRINVNEDYELRDWAEKFGVSPDQLKEAVQAVGDNADNVEQHLRKQFSDSGARKSTGGGRAGGEGPSSGRERK
jgi:DNA-binding transcriptional LysR family regulator